MMIYKKWITTYSKKKKNKEKRKHEEHLICDRKNICYTLDDWERAIIISREYIILVIGHTV